MANRTNEIGDIVKKAKVLLLDIEGTTTSISFVKDKLFPYAEENVKKYLEDNWDEDEIKEIVGALRKLAVEDEEKSVEGFIKIPAEDASKDDQIEGIVKNFKWLMSADRKVGPLKNLQGLIWKKGYDNGDIKGHVYDDVSPALEQWHGVEGQKIYIYSSGSVQAQKLLFGQSLSGNLLSHIDGHFDTNVGAKQEAASYTKIVEEIGCKADEILFLTDILKEAEAASTAGLQTALLSREGNAPLPDDVTATYPVLHSFGQLVPSNKRKPDEQDESPKPAKVPKTETENEATSLEETSAKTENDAKIEDVAKTEDAAKTEDSAKPEEFEKMEVEETNNKTEESKSEEVPAPRVETIVEEITDSNEAVSVPVVNVEPIVTEEKSDSEKSEEVDMAMDTDNAESKPVTNGTAKNGTVDSPIENSPTLVTVEDVTEEKEVTETAKDNEDIQPVVEEPKSVERDAAELQNVGEVLEKECDDILSRVQNVTNLDNIGLRPINNITDTNMEAENEDTNDIVDGILDTEQLLGGDIDLDTVSEVIAEKKPENSTEKDSKNDVKAPTTKSGDSEEKTTENNEITSNGKEEKVEEIKPVEAETVEEENSKTESKETELKDMPVETKEDETITGDKVEESQVNGNGTNGNTEALNGDASKDEELNSRLTAENGKEVTNGANGNSNGLEEAKGEQKTDAEVSEIKVKTTPAETPTDPIEQVAQA